MLAHQSTLHHWTEPGGHSPSAKVLPPAQSPRRTVFKFEQKPAPSEVAVPVASTSPQCRCLLDELWGEMFEPLKDEALFATARQDGELEPSMNRKGIILAGGSGTRPRWTAVELGITLRNRRRC